MGLASIAAACRLAVRRLARGGYKAASSQASEPGEQRASRTHPWFATTGPTIRSSIASRPSKYAWKEACTAALPALEAPPPVSGMNVAPAGAKSRARRGFELA